MQILFATDLQPNTGNAYRYCLLLAQQSRSEIIVLHVFHHKRYRDLNELQRELFYKKEKEAMIAKTKHFAQLYPNLIEPEKLMRVDIKTEVEEGDEFEVISRVARENGVDMVVICAKQSPGVFTGIFGSVSKKLIYSFELPLLIVPEKFKGELPGRIGSLGHNERELDALLNWAQQDASLRSDKVIEYFLTGESTDSASIVRHGTMVKSIRTPEPAEIVSRMEEDDLDLLILSSGPHDQAGRTHDIRHRLIHFLYDRFRVPFVVLKV